jgi:hypothetical protein
VRRLILVFAAALTTLGVASPTGRERRQVEFGKGQGVSRFADDLVLCGCGLLGFADDSRLADDGPFADEGGFDGDDRRRRMVGRYRQRGLVE